MVSIDHPDFLSVSSFIVHDNLVSKTINHACLTSIGKLLSANSLFHIAEDSQQTRIVHWD